VPDPSDVWGQPLSLNLPRIRASASSDLMTSTGNAKVPARTVA
jgi:hypothetical protein